MRENKTKMKRKTIKKSQRETTLELEKLRKRSGVIDASITNRIQEIEERISGAEDNIENIGGGGTAQQVRALTTLLKVLSSNPSSHMVAHSHLI
jgi:predicted  nucleic acid-binding Zn-ribbon protein